MYPPYPPYPQGQPPQWQPSQPPQWQPPAPRGPSPYQQGRKLALRREGNFIGMGMLFLLALNLSIFSILILVLQLCGVIGQEELRMADFGLGSVGYMVLYATAYIVMMGAPMPVAALITRKPIQPFGPAKRVRPFTFIAGIFAGVALCIVANVITSYLMAFLQALGIPQPPMPDLMDQTPLSLILNLVIFAVLPALLEEMAFRGYLLQVLRPYGDRVAVLVSAILFALMHGNVLQIPFAFLVGLVLGYAVVQTNNFWLAVCIHFANNAMSTLIQYAQQFCENTNQEQILIIGIFAVLGIVGFVLLIILKVRNDPLTQAVAPSPDRTPTAGQVGTVLASPAVLVAMILFGLVTVMNTVGSMLV